MARNFQETTQIYTVYIRARRQDSSQYLVARFLHHDWLSLTEKKVKVFDAVVKRTINSCSHERRAAVLALTRTAFIRPWPDGFNLERAQAHSPAIFVCNLNFFNTSENLKQLEGLKIEKKNKHDIFFSKCI